MKNEIKNIEASVKAKLQNKAKETIVPFRKSCSITAWRGFSTGSANQNTQISLY